MTNYIQKGNVLLVLLAAAVDSGDILAKGEVIGVAATDGAIGDTIAVNVEGVYDLPKESGAIDQGAKLYFKASAGTVTTDDETGDNEFIGYAWEGAVIAAPSVPVKLATS